MIYFAILKNIMGNLFLIRIEGFVKIIFELVFLLINTETEIPFSLPHNVWMASLSIPQYRTGLFKSTTRISANTVLFTQILEDEVDHRLLYSRGQVVVKLSVYQWDYATCIFLYSLCTHLLRIHRFMVAWISETIHIPHRIVVIVVICVIISLYFVRVLFISK